MQDGQRRTSSVRVSPRLIEGRDYRVDAAGRVVFTAAYLMSRGVCCGSKCRNCPYGWEFVPDAERVAGEPQPPLDEACRRWIAENESLD